MFVYAASIYLSVKAVWSIRTRMKTALREALDPQSSAKGAEVGSIKYCLALVSSYVRARAHRPPPGKSPTTSTHAPFPCAPHDTRLEWYLVCNVTFVANEVTPYEYSYHRTH